MRSRIITAILAITAGLGLAACGSSEPTTSTPTASAVPSNTAANTAENTIKVYPSVGDKSAVDQHGTAASIGTNNMLTYTCKPQYDSVTVPFLRAVDWNGIVLEWLNAYPQTNAIDGQSMVHIVAHDDQKLGLWQPVAMIVTVHSKDTDSKTIRLFDDSVATLSKHEAPNGIWTYELSTINFSSGGGYISDVTFCVQKPSAGA